MHAVAKTIALGVAAYVSAALGIWFVLSYLLMPVAERVIWILPAATTLVPLFFSGYVAARHAKSSHRTRRVGLGVVAGVTGFGLFLVITQARGEIWLFVILSLGAAVVAAIGGLAGTRPKNPGPDHSLS